MKNILTALTCFFLFSNAVLGQNTQTRQYILDKLLVFYIDNPSAAMPAPGPALQAMEVDCGTIFNGNDLTTPLWTNANNDGLKNLLIKLLRVPGGTTGGDANLQRLVRNVLMITGKKVKVYLYNDFTLSGAPAASWSIYCPGDSNYPTGFGNREWPCANTITDPDFTGHIAMGAYFFKGYTANMNWKIAAFIHELSHTQLAINNSAGLPAGMSFYGAGGHQYDEMIPSYNLAFNEGLGNGFAFRYYLGDLGMTAWYNNNVPLYVDDIACTNASQSYCLQSRLAASTPPLPGTACTIAGNSAKCYPIRDIPAPILMYNENVYSNIFYQFMTQFQSGEYLLSRSVKDALPNITAASGKPFAALYKEMVKKGMNFRHTRLPEGQVTHGQHLPLGILDYYTGYRLANKATLESCLGTTWDATDTNIDGYFSNKRSVLLGFRANTTDWQVQQINRFAENLNVKVPVSSTPPTSPTGN